MPYAATWSNANAQGRLDAGAHAVRLSDARELAGAINRRRLLTYQDEQDFSSHLHGGAAVRQPTIAGCSWPFDDLRAALSWRVLQPPVGSMGGDPQTPQAMEWLWPVDDGDEGKTIVRNMPAEGQVGLFDKLNGAGAWTDGTLQAGRSAVRAVHFNELRQVAEWLTRGRWVLPVYFAAGIFSPLPDAPWIGDTIANNGCDELRSVGFAVIRCGEPGTADKGLTNVTVRPASSIGITADADCTVEVYRCLRPVDFVADAPTWNEFAPASSQVWSSPGGTGPQDAQLLGSLALQAGQEALLSGPALVEAVQAMIDGGEQNFLLRRTDSGPQTIAVAGRLVIEFDLNSPPN